MTALSQLNSLIQRREEVRLDLPSVYHGSDCSSCTAMPNWGCNVSQFIRHKLHRQKVLPHWYPKKLIVSTNIFFSGTFFVTKVSMDRLLALALLNAPSL
jgi:hypothetical protein